MKKRITGEIIRARKRKLKQVLTFAVPAAAVCVLVLILVLLSGKKEKEAELQFAQVTPVEKGITYQDLSASMPAAATRSVSVSGKMPYTRLKGGDTMYSGYFGLLNVRSAPSKEASLVGRIAYGEEVRVFWKEDTGYVRIVCRLHNSEDYIEGYCLREDLVDEEPADGRVLLNVKDFKQYDERWGSISLGDSYETIKSAGCTTTCLAMAYSYLEGTVTTPSGMEERLWYTSDGNLGFPKVYEQYDGDDYLNVVLKKLREGIPVLIGGYDTSGGPHWVLAVGYQGDGEELLLSDFLIHDPASEERPTLEEYFTDYPYFNKIAYYSG